MADQIVTVRPTAVTGAWVVVGSPNGFTALSDNSDTTWVHAGAGVKTRYYAQMAVPPSFSSDRRIVGVTVRLREKAKPANPNTRALTFGLSAGSGTTDWQKVDNSAVQVFDTTIQNYQGPIWTYRVYQSYTPPPGMVGAAWVQIIPWVYTDFNNMWVWLLDDGGNDIELYELFADITYNVTPKVSNLQPTGAVVDNPNPTVTWTYTDAEGDAQERYWVKVFDQATYLAGGFNQDTATPVWESGAVYSSATSVQIIGPGYHPYSGSYPNVVLQNGVTYQVYVKTGDVGGSSKWGDWNYIGGLGSPGSPITISFSPPSQPTNLTCTPDNANARYVIKYVAGYNPGTDKFEIQRSDDGGTTWINPRGGDNIAATPLSAADSDFETGVGTWVAGANTTIAQSAAQFFSGTKSLSLTATAGGSVQAQGSQYAISPNQIYTVSARFRANTIARNCTISMEFFDSTHTLISGDSADPGVNDSNTGWTQDVRTFGVSPSNAAYMRILIQVNGCAAAEVHYVDGITTPAAQFYDYESLPLVTPIYRIRPFRLVGGASLPNTFTNINPSTPMAPGKWWLKDPLDYSRNVGIEVVPPFNFQRPEPESFYDALGRTSSIWMSDGIKSIKGSLKIRTRTKADYDKLWTIIGGARALLLEDWSLGRRWFIKLGDSGDYTTVMSAPDAGSTTTIRHLHETTYAFSEVATI